MALAALDNPLLGALDGVLLEIVSGGYRAHTSILWDSEFWYKGSFVASDGKMISSCVKRYWKMFRTSRWTKNLLMRGARIQPLGL